MKIGRIFMKRKKQYNIGQGLGLLLFIFIFSCTANKKVVDDEFATDTASEDSFSADGPVSEDDLFAENSMSDAGTETQQSSDIPGDQAQDESGTQQQAAADEFGDFEEPPPSQEEPAQTNEQQAQAENLDELTLDDTPQNAEMTPSPESLADEQNMAAAEPVPEPIIETPAPEVVPSFEEPVPVAEAPTIVTPEPIVESSTEETGVTVPTSEMAQIKEVNFRGNENGGALVIKADKELQFTTRLNSTTNQVVLEVNNAIIPKKLMRPLITKDMSSSIGTIDIYQRPNSSIARFVIQLRADSAEPLVQPEGDTLLVIGTPMFANRANQMGSAEVQVPLNQAQNQMGQNEQIPNPVVTQDPLAPEQSGSSPLQTQVPPPPTVLGNQLPNSIIPLQINGSTVDLGQQGLDKTMSLTQNKEIYTKGLLSSRDLQDFLTNNNRYYGKKISIVTQDLEVRDVLNFLSEEASINLIYDDDIAGKVSIKLRRVPWDQALVTLLKSKKLGYQRQGSILRIARLETLLKEEDEAVRVRDARLDQEPLLVRNFRINYAEIATLESKIKEFITDSKKDAVNRGRVSSDTRTNTIIVTETPTKLKQVEDLIQALDTQPQQVQIEARIIEASESFSKSVGARWGLNNGTVGNTEIPVPFDRGRVSTGISGSDLTAMPSLSLAPELGLKGGVLNTNLWLGRIGAFGDLELNLSLGQIENKIKVLSSPRIVVLSGTAAVVNQTVKVNVPDESTTLTATTGSATTSVKTKSIDAGVTLNVTPQISNIDTVRLKLAITKSVISNTQGDTTSRNATTEIILKSMQTAVIGGVFESQQIDGRSGVPGLQEIPVLGALFRGKEESSQKSELMIFVTPKILPPLNLPGDALGMVPKVNPPSVPSSADQSMNSIVQPLPDTTPIPSLELAPEDSPETTTEEELVLE
jgi:type IV pilus secretin PilQ/predicted competence protein